jgi:hypothetical protein
MRMILLKLGAVAHSFDIGVTYTLRSQAKAHARIIWDCSWSHDDILFATASRDKTVSGTNYVKN